MTCEGIDYFWLNGIEVFDSAGRKVLHFDEEEYKRKNPQSKQLPDRAMSCTRNFPIEIPARTIVHGTFSKPTHDFSRGLEEYYSLPPGHYIVVPTLFGRYLRPITRTLTDFSAGLWVTVEEP